MNDQLPVKKEHLVTMKNGFVVDISCASKAGCTIGPSSPLDISCTMRECCTLRRTLILAASGRPRE